MRVGFVLLFVCAAQADDQLWRKTLERHGVRPTGPSIGAYLRLHYAQGKKLQAIRKHLSYLEARDPVLRRAAARELVRMAPAPLVAIRSAGSDDPDARRWLNTLAEQMSAWIKPDVLDACFRTIHARRLVGLAPEVLNVFPLCKADRLQSSASRALQATVGPQDVRVLVDALQGGSGRTRFAAALAYGALLKQDALPTLRAALRDKNEDLRLAAAHALANLGDRSCLRPLGELLDSADVWVRLVSVRTLRAISPKRFGYWCFDTPKFRNKAAVAWREEIRNLRTWKTPLPQPPEELGRTLVSNWTERRIVELNRAGQVIWQVKTTKQPWANCGLPNGHRVVCFHNGKVIVEYDSHGSVRWTTHLPDRPTSVERMRPLVAAGNLLVACGRQLVELNARGRIVRKIALPSMAYHAHPLSNGNFLVALGQLGKVVEISRGGRITWELAGLLRPNVAQPLPNGNVLVCESGAGRAVEYNREKRVVWSRAGLPNLIVCQRLSNGLTMLATRNSVRLVDPAGVTRWQKRFTGYICASRY